MNGAAPATSSWIRVHAKQFLVCYFPPFFLLVFLRFGGCSRAAQLLTNYRRIVNHHPTTALTRDIFQDSKKFEVLKCNSRKRRLLKSELCQLGGAGIGQSSLLSGISLGLQHSHVRQRAVLLVMIKAITHHKLVRALHMNTCYQIPPIFPNPDPSPSTVNMAPTCPTSTTPFILA